MQYNAPPMSKPITDQTLQARINLYYDLQPAQNSPAPLLIALHGYGAFKEQMMREAQQMAPDGFAIASLQGFHQHIKEPRQPGGPLRYGFGWLTSYRTEESVAVHHQALLDLIETLAGEGVADRSQVFLLGFSQSCALNYRFAFTYPERLRGLSGSVAACRVIGKRALFIARPRSTCFTSPGPKMSSIRHPELRITRNNWKPGPAL
jgi:poly(3-hydroxybutyrate) depolymerase